jgi:hypothetical protein
VRKLVWCGLLILLTAGCQSIKVEDADPASRLIPVETKDWREYKYRHTSGQELVFRYFEDADGHGQLMREVICQKLQSAFKDRLLCPDLEEVKIYSDKGLLKIQVVYQKYYYQIAYQVLDVMSFDFIATEVICPRLLGQKMAPAQMS